MRYSKLILPALLLSSCLAARANDITTFSLDTTFENGLNVTGSLTIDTTYGNIVGVSLDQWDRAYIWGGGEQGGTIEITDMDQYDMFLNMPVDSLVGYTGGSICDTSGNGCSPDYDQPSSIFLSDGEMPLLTDGSLTDESTLQESPLLFANDFPPAAAATPEPSSLILLSTGLLGAAGILRRRSA